MSLSTRIAPHLAYLRRFSRAVTGSQTSGDAYVAAMLEALVSDISIYPEDRNDRIALFRLYCTLFENLDVTLPDNTSPFGWERQAAANLANLPPAARKAFLLVAVEGFDMSEAADILDVSEERFAILLDEA
ncbi:MAG: sigma factor-like helix-turn-helix DNA-binding protein, partial [Shinella sp.]